MKSNYIVFYVENCETKVKQFKTESSAIRFANKLDTIDKAMRYSDTWVDCIVKGNFVRTYGTFKASLEDK